MFARRPLHRGCGLKYYYYYYYYYYLNQQYKRRPLHRGCGLKWKKNAEYNNTALVALFTEGVD